jgi:serine/threonine-protein kinase HipA
MTIKRWRPHHEYASLQLEKDEAEKDKDYMKWLKLLVAPGGSLGGARPKASIVDDEGELWIAKFPSKNDDLNIGAWEFIVHKLAIIAKIETSEAQIKKFTGNYDTFLTKRFDRNNGKRIHFVSAMTLLDRKDGDGAEEGVSYLDLVDFLTQNGSQVESDLQELWRRIVFNICISNVDDHLRNHGFILTGKGWKLAPAYDMNPSETGDGLKLNLSKDDNSQSLDLALEVAEYFRLKKSKASEIISEVISAVLQWESLAKKLAYRPIFLLHVLSSFCSNLLGFLLRAVHILMSGRLFPRSIEASLRASCRSCLVDFGPSLSH